MKRIILVLFSALILSNSAIAQTSTQSTMTGFRRGLATVMLAGFGGAILGLSTLSFYGEPQEHIGNIWAGFAIGLVGGSAYVISQNSKADSLALDPFPQSAKLKLAHQNPPLFQYSWNF